MFSVLALKYVQVFLLYRWCRSSLFFQCGQQNRRCPTGFRFGKVQREVQHRRDRWWGHRRSRSPTPPGRCHDLPTQSAESQRRERRIGDTATFPRSSQHGCCIRRAIPGSYRPVVKLTHCTAFARAWCWILVHLPQGYAGERSSRSPRAGINIASCVLTSAAEQQRCGVERVARH
jgi:hypothetical protein